MTGPDLPTPHGLFDIETCRHRWPSGSAKAELYAGVLVFSGDFDQRDVLTAQRAFPGRQVILNEGGGLEIPPRQRLPSCVDLPPATPERMTRLLERRTRRGNEVGRLSVNKVTENLVRL